MEKKDYNILDTEQSQLSRFEQISEKISQMVLIRNYLLSHVSEINCKINRLQKMREEEQKKKKGKE